MRRAARRDGSEAEIISALEACGFTVQQLSQKDVPDLLIAKGGRLWLAEVKTGKAKLRPGQQRFVTKWPVIVLRSVEDVAQLCSGTR